MNCYRLGVGVFVIIVISVVVGYRLYAAPVKVSKAQSASETSIEQSSLTFASWWRREGEFFVLTLSVMKLFGATRLSFIKPLRARSWGAWGQV
jgi:hypothetical protein